MGLLDDWLSTMPNKATLVYTILVLTSTRSGAGTLRIGAVATGYYELGTQWHGEDDLVLVAAITLGETERGHDEGWVGENGRHIIDLM